METRCWYHEARRKRKQDVLQQGQLEKGDISFCTFLCYYMFYKKNYKFSCHSCIQHELLSIKFCFVFFFKTSTFFHWSVFSKISVVSLCERTFIFEETPIFEKTVDFSYCHSFMDYLYVQKLTFIQDFQVILKRISRSWVNVRTFFIQSRRG